MRKQTLFYITYFVVLLIFVISSFFLLNFEVENHKSYTTYRQVVENVSFRYQEEEYPYLDVDLNEAISQNSDTVGWIEVQGTNVFYPVVQTSDNSYYLNHSFNREENSAGWVFMDYRNQDIMDDQVILYAHNRLDGSMFGSLKNLLTSIEHSYLFYNTYSQKMTYQIFSVYTIDVDEFQNTIIFSSDLEHMQFLEDIQKRSVVVTDTIVNSSDKILTLYTCYGYGRERLIVHAKLIQLKSAS